MCRAPRERPGPSSLEVRSYRETVRRCSRRSRAGSRDGDPLMATHTSERVPAADGQGASARRRGRPALRGAIVDPSTMGERARNGLRVRANLRRPRYLLSPTPRANSPIPTCDPRPYVACTKFEGIHRCRQTRAGCRLRRIARLVPRECLRSYAGALAPPHLGRPSAPSHSAQPRGLSCIMHIIRNLRLKGSCGPVGSS